jgi:hypothetical protein
VCKKSFSNLLFFYFAELFRTIGSRVNVLAESNRNRILVDSRSVVNLANRRADLNRPTCVWKIGGCICGIEPHDDPIGFPNVNLAEKL